MAPQSVTYLIANTPPRPLLSIILVKYTKKMKQHRAKKGYSMIQKMRVSAFLVILQCITLGARTWQREDLLKYDVDFDRSMSFDQKDKFYKRRQKSKKNKVTSFCRELYQKNNLLTVVPHENTLIPKIVHLIWVGPKTPPPVFNRCVESIKKHMPDWELKIWTDADLPKLKLVNQQYYDEETNYGAKADILRYEILYQFGGTYLDVDFVVTQPLDILNHAYEFYTCMMPSRTKASVITNGIIASVPGHPILKHSIDTIKKHRKRKDILRRVGPQHFESSFYEMAQQLPDSRIVAFPRTFFFPLEIQEAAGETIEVPAETFGIHYWTASWSDKLSTKRRNHGAHGNV